MGVSNSEMLDLNALEIDFLARSTLEFQDHDQCEIIATKEDHHDEGEDECKIVVASLNIKIPSFGEFKIEEEFDHQEDFDSGFKTPTSLDHQIPVMLQCPAAPRKPKSRPLLTKRKAQSQSQSQSQSQRRILYDLSNEIEALFPPALLADLGNKIKKAKQQN